MEEDKTIIELLKEEVFTGLGEASMCWSETPKGVFESERVSAIGDKIMKAVYRLVRDELAGLNANGCEGHITNHIEIVFGTYERLVDAELEDTK